MNDLNGIGDDIMAECSPHFDSTRRRCNMVWMWCVTVGAEGVDGSRGRDLLLFRLLPGSQVGVCVPLSARVAFFGVAMLDGLNGIMIRGLRRFIMPGVASCPSSRILADDGEARFRCGVLLDMFTSGLICFGGRGSTAGQF